MTLSKDLQRALTEVAGVTNSIPLQMPGEDALLLEEQSVA
jgi:hypothetical protein